MDIRVKVVQECIKRLEAAGALYHIMDAEGGEYGHALGKPDKKKKGEPGVRTINRDKSAARNRYILPFLMNLEVGSDPVDIPYSTEFDVNELQSNVGAKLSQVFGKDGSYITSRNNEKRALQVMLVKNITGMGAAQAIAKSYGPGSVNAHFVEELLEKVSRDKKVTAIKKAS